MATQGVGGSVKEGHNSSTHGFTLVAFSPSVDGEGSGKSGKKTHRLDGAFKTPCILNNGLKYQPQLVQAGRISEPSTV